MEVFKSKKIIQEALDAIADIEKIITPNQKKLDDNEIEKMKKTKIALWELIKYINGKLKK